MVKFAIRGFSKNVKNDLYIPEIDEHGYATNMYNQVAFGDLLDSSILNDILYFNNSCKGGRKMRKCARMKRMQKPVKLASMPF